MLLSLENLKSYVKYAVELLIRFIFDKTKFIVLQI